MPPKESSAIKGTREYNAKIRRADVWLSRDYPTGDELIFQKMNHIFDESLVVLEFQKDLESTSYKPEGGDFKKFLEIDIKSVLIELKEDKSKESLKGIFVRLLKKIEDFYSLTLEDDSITLEEQEMKIKWKSELDKLGL